MAEQELTEGVWTVETLRVYQEALRTAEEKFQDERDRRYRELAAERGKALSLQQAEYERRLNTLNHAHEQAVEVQHTYVTDEKFGDFVKRYEENREVVAKALTLAEGRGVGVSAAMGWIVAVVTIVISLSVVLVTVLK